MINFQRPAFPDLTNFCNKHLYMKLLSQFRAVHCYGSRNTRKGKQNCLRLLHKSFILIGLFRIPLQLCFSHMLTFICYVEVYFMFAFLGCVCYNMDFVKSRFIISRLGSTHFIVILAWLKKIIRYTKDFGLQTFVKSRFHCIQPPRFEP